MSGSRLSGVVEVAVTALFERNGFSQGLEVTVLTGGPPGSGVRLDIVKKRWRHLYLPVGEAGSRILPPHRRSLCGTVGEPVCAIYVIDSPDTRFPVGFVDSTALPAPSTATETDSAQEIALSGMLPSISTGELHAPSPASFREVRTFPAPAAATGSVRAGSAVRARKP